MLEIKNLKHSFGERVLYDNVNLKINKGDKIGLVGENGAGKSTLINILNGTLLSDDGDVVWEKNVTVGYLDQFAKLDENQTIQQYLESAFKSLFDTEKKFNQTNEQMAFATDEAELNKLLELSGKYLDKLTENNFYGIPSEINKVASGLGITDWGMDKKVKQLSGGQRVKLTLCKLLLEQPTLLILDEPTNFLDVAHIEWLTKFLQEYKGCFLIVSHDIPFLNSVVNKIWAIDMQTVSEYYGNYDQYVRLRNEHIVQHNHQVAQQQQQMEKLKDYIARNGVRASTARQAQSRAKQLQKLQENALSEIHDTNPPDIHFKYKHIDNRTLIVLHNLEIGYDHPIVSGITFTLLNGDKLRINGFNGVGKTTLFKTILHEIPPLAGTVNINNNVVFGYYEQDHKFQNPEWTAIDEVAFFYPKLNQNEVRSALSKAGLSTKKQLQPIGSLSGGEQCKIQLCLICMAPCNVLFLDEPTNHLDVKAKNVLAKAINEFPGSVIYVSHENEFADMIENNKEINLGTLSEANQ